MLKISPFTPVMIILLLYNRIHSDGLSIYDNLNLTSNFFIYYKLSYSMTSIFYFSFTNITNKLF